MAKIEEIDYDEMIRKANQIAAKSNSMQKSVQAAYKEMENMSEDWFGNSYDNFVTAANLCISSLNKIFEVTVNDIPHEIAAKAKSYASSNQATPTVSFVEQTYLTLSDLPKTGKGAKLRFRQEKVNTDKTTITTKLKNAKTSADEAKTVATSLKNVWQSVSGDTNITELENAFTRLGNIIAGLSVALEGQIKQQALTIEALETAAETVEAAKDFAEDAVDATVDAAKAAVTNIKETAEDVWQNLTGKN